MPAIPFIPSVVTATPFASPDYSFLSSQVQRANQQYEEGLRQVESDYSAVISAPVTGDAMNQKKAEYAKQFQEGIKKLAGSNLSLPQAQMQAEKIMAPFWQDDLLVQNMGMTKYAHNQLSTLDSWKNSTDKDVRSQYSDYAAKYIQQGLQDLGNAPVDKQSYNRLQKRDAVPFYDIDADVDAAWQKEVGAKGIDRVLTNGATMITQTNGIQSKDAYRTYYMSKVGRKYDPQLHVIASVQAHDAKQAIMQQYPGISGDQVNQMFAQDRMKELAHHTQQAANAYSTQAQYWGKRAQDLADQIKTQPNGADAVQMGNLQYYRQQAMDAQKGSDEYSKEYWTKYSPTTLNQKTNEQYYKTLSDIGTNPEDYLMQIQKGIAADTWASGRASVTSEKRELDQPWAEMQKVMYQNAVLRKDYAQMALTKRGQDIDVWKNMGIMPGTNQQDPRFRPDQGGWSYTAPTGKGGTTGRIGSGPGDINPLTGQVLGTNTIDVTHLPSALDVIQDKLHQQAADVSHSIYDASTNSVTSTVMRSLGMDDNKIIALTQGAKKAMSGAPTTPEEKTAMGEAAGLLKAHGIGYDIHGPQAMMTAIMQYSGDVAKQLTQSDKASDKAMGYSILQGVADINNKRDVYLKSQQNYDKAVSDELSSNPLYNKITVQEGDKRRLVTGEDMKNSGVFPHLVLRRKNPEYSAWNGQPSMIDNEYSADQFANDWAHGKIQVDNHSSNTGNGRVIVDGQPYEVVAINGDDRMGNSEKWNTTIFGGRTGLVNHSNSIMGRFGSSGEVGALKQKAGEVVSRNMGLKNGIISKEYGWDVQGSKRGNEAEEVFAANLAPELALPSNTSNFYSYGSNTKPEPLSPKDEQAVRSVLSNTADLQDKVGSIGWTRNDQNEKVAVLHFQQSSSKKDEEHFPLAGKTVYLKVSPNASGRLINTIPENTGNYLWEGLYNGESYKSDPTFEAAGFRYNMQGFDPGPDGRMTRANYTQYQTLPDPDNPHNTVEVPVVRITLPLTGPGAKNPDEIRAAIYGSAAKHAATAIENVKVGYSKIQGVPLNAIR